ncbi:hypothetical protein [Leptolyngbya sp. FACHB-711]|uniref:hypothetical protein n=1 Tax=unclassified Leptolyngbya TaxID=2650499 RepID=UPI0016879869|nr:hypothetical protein [Leptolyngbya sp. FACHB-711]MBD1852800.1 hypothetical protein [Cyanobacteria bacterium FACHB-502]MBD2024009.1 hypothetical protein [Leptolyngbya sp. FACHB-711]
MQPIEQLELPFWEMLKEATIAPDEANLQQLLDVLESALANLDTVGQLQMAAEAIAQIVQVFQKRSVLAFEELEATASEEGPVMPLDAFDRYVRQTMEVDFELFIEPIERLPRKMREQQERLPLWGIAEQPDEMGSVIGELDQAALLQALDEQMSQAPGLTEVEAFNKAMGIAHDEDVSTWTEAIAQCLRKHQIATIPLVQLQQMVRMPLVQLWLALLLGGFTIEQRGKFYETEQIWVLVGC